MLTTALERNKENMAESLVYKGSLVGHAGSVTAIATSPELPDAIVTASRDRKLILWQLTRDEVRLSTH